MHRSASRAALLLTLVAACGRTQVYEPPSANPAPRTLLIVTSGDWRITGAAPPSPEWGTLASFDDSAWQPAPVIVARGTSSGQTGDAIWDQGPTITSGSKQVWARHRFNIDGTVGAARVEAQCNDDMEVWLNGTQVIADADGVTTRMSVSEVNRLLTRGENLIAATCVDRIPPEHSFWAALTVTLF